MNTDIMVSDDKVERLLSYAGLTHQAFLDICANACINGQFGKESPYEYLICANNEWQLWGIGEVLHYPGVKFPAIQFHAKIAFKTPALKAQFLQYLGGYDEQANH